MLDPISNAAIESTTNDAQGVLTRLFGPTADIMGSQMAQAYQEKLIKRVIKKADRKVRAESYGSIPPRVAKEVFDKAQWAENEFVADYLSGVLASSRSEDGRTDNGVTWTALIGRLSSDQIAIHWIVYSATQERSRTEKFEDIWSLLKQQQIWDVRDIISALGWELTQETLVGRLYEAMYGLKREGLLTNLSHGPGDYLAGSVSWTAGHQFSPELNYVTFKLTNDGVGLLLQSLGLGKSWYAEFFSDKTSAAIDSEQDLPRSKNARFLRDFPQIVAG